MAGVSAGAIAVTAVHQPTPLGVLRRPHLTDSVTPAVEVCLPGRLQVGACGEVRIVGGCRGLEKKLCATSSPMPMTLGFPGEGRSTGLHAGQRDCMSRAAGWGASGTLYYVTYNRSSFVGSLQEAQYRRARRHCAPRCSPGSLPPGPCYDEPGAYTAYCGSYARWL
jgi:hypothetical protein